MQRHTIIGQYRICLRYALLWMATKKKRNITHVRPPRDASENEASEDCLDISLMSAEEAGN